MLEGSVQRVYVRTSLSGASTFTWTFRSVPFEFTAKRILNNISNYTISCGNVKTEKTKGSSGVRNICNHHRHIVMTEGHLPQSTCSLVLLSAVVCSLVSHESPRHKLRSLFDCYSLLIPRRECNRDRRRFRWGRLGRTERTQLEQLLWLVSSDSDSLAADVTWSHAWPNSASCGARQGQSRRRYREAHVIRCWHDRMSEWDK